MTCRNTCQTRVDSSQFPVEMLLPHFEAKLSSTHPLPLVGETPSGVVGDAPFDHETRLEVKHDICWRSFTCTQIS